LASWYCWMNPIDDVSHSAKERFEWATQSGLRLVV
jgi:hypothetical protein